MKTESHTERVIIMKEQENNFLKNMDDISVEEIAEFTEGIDSRTKQRILENCRRKMKNSDTNGVNDMKNRKAENSYEENAEIKKDKGKIKYIRPLISLAACAVLIAGTTAVISSLKNKNGEIKPVTDPSAIVTEPAVSTPAVSTPAVSGGDTAVTSVKKETVPVIKDDLKDPVVTQTDTTAVSQTFTEPAVSETENPAESTATDEQKQDKPADMSREYTEIFREMAPGAAKAFKIIEGFGISGYIENEKCLFIGPDDKVVFYGTNEEFYESDDKPSFYKVAYVLADEEIKTNDDYINYVYSYFDKDLKNFNKDEKRIFSYDDRDWVIIPQRGFLFTEFSTEDAKISDIIPDSSFVITAHDKDPAAANFDYKLTFTRNDEGWRISRIDDENGYNILE